jgi:cell division protease FtsH
VSDETVRAIDSEIRSLIDRNYQRSVDILKENEDKLHVMADALMKYETIDSSQIDSIMDGKVPGPPQDWTDDESSSSGSGGNSPPVVAKETKENKSPDLSDPATKFH